MARVLFFARFREKTGASELHIENVHTLQELLDELKRRFPFLEHEHFFVAVNEEVVHEPASFQIEPDDEIALFPMVAGG